MTQMGGILSGEALAHATGDIQSAKISGSGPDYSKLAVGAATV